MILPHPAQHGDREQGSDGVQHGDNDETRRPASRRLFEKRRRRAAEDRADPLGHIEEAVIGGGVSRPERIRQRRGKQRKYLTPTEEDEPGQYHKQRRLLDEGEQ